MQRNYGSKRDVSDHRDLIKRYGERPSDKKHDLVRYIHHVYDQGGLDSCTSNVVCAAYGLELMRQSMEDNTFKYFDSSRLFLYYNSRLYDGTTDQNVGVSFRDVFKAMKKYGVCTESLWPYDERKFSKKPLSNCYKKGLGNSIVKYTRLEQDIDQFRACLKADYPFTVGFEVYSSFNDLDNDTIGLMPMPTENEILLESPSLHAVLAVGYDDNTRCITILNSWGSSFGDNGYFYMPYDYILNTGRAYDFWKIEEVGESQQPSDI